MQVIKIEGDHYSLGRHLGLQAKETFARYILKSEYFQRLLPWRDNGWLDRTDQLLIDQLPLVRIELQGIADGLEQDYRDVLLWNCRGDLLPTGPEGCSSVALHREHDSLLAHNEDGDPQLKSASFILDATLINGPRMICFCYPGSLPGHTLGANSYGVAYTVNNIRLRDNPEGLPRMATARTLLESKNCDDFLNALRVKQRSGGFHFMVADSQGKGFSVEAPLQGVSTQSLSQIQVHANHLVHSAFSTVSQLITASSQSRQLRLEQLSAETQVFNEQALLAMLADQHDAKLPIYRNAADDPDDENTLATVIFRVTAQGIDVRIRESALAEVSFNAFIAKSDQENINVNNPSRKPSNAAAA